LGADALLNSEAVDQSHWSELWEGIRNNIKPLDTRCLLACSKGSVSAAVETLGILRRAAKAVAIIERSLESALLSEGLVQVALENNEFEESVKTEEAFSGYHTHHHDASLNSTSNSDFERRVSNALSPIHIRLQRLSCLSEAFLRAEARAISIVFVSAAQPWFQSLNCQRSVSLEGGDAALGEAIWHLGALFTWLRESSSKPSDDDVMLMCRVLNVVDALAIQSILQISSHHDHRHQQLKYQQQELPLQQQGRPSSRIRQFLEQLDAISSCFGVDPFENEEKEGEGLYNPKSRNGDKLVSESFLLLFPACGELASIYSMPHAKVKSLVEAIASLLDGESTRRRRTRKKTTSSKHTANHGYIGKNIVHENDDEDDEDDDDDDDENEVDEEGTVGTEIISNFLHMARSSFTRRDNLGLNNSDSMKLMVHSAIASVSMATLSPSRGLLAALTSRSQLKILTSFLE
jgi:hypothetical protein